MISVLGAEKLSLVEIEAFLAPSTLIIHPQLARSDSFRLILRWNQLPAPGSSCVGQE